jgi:nucleoside-diphosphate-sugar epimerase
VLDVTRAQQALGWTAATSFETGLSRTIAWMRRTLEGA